MRFKVVQDTHINFVGQRRIAYVLSSLFIVVAVVSIFFGSEPRLGIDFAGGVIVQVQFKEPVED